MSLGEIVQLGVFALLAASVIGASLGVVLLNNIVYSAFLLGGVFVSISGLYVLLNADFVAAAQVLIYVGAVNVLILFAIMLVNKQEDFSVLPNLWLKRATTGLVCLGLFALLGTMVFATPWSFPTEALPTDQSVMLIGQHFFSDFLLPFEVASVFLLMAMVGAIILARREYIPEETVPDTLPSADLKLPERPRELIGSGSGQSKAETN